MGFSEINHKINMKVKNDCQVITSPLLQSMLGFKQAIFPAGEDGSDWVVDVKKGLKFLYVYFSWGNREWWEMPTYRYRESYRWKEETDT